MKMRTVARDDYTKITLGVAPGQTRAKFRAIDYDGEVEFHLDIVDLARLRQAIDDTIKDLLETS